MESKVEKGTKKLDILFYIFFYSIIEWLILSVQFSYKDKNFFIFILFLSVFFFFLNEIHERGSKLFDNGKKTILFLVIIHGIVFALSYFIGYLEVELIQFII